MRQALLLVAVQNDRRHLSMQHRCQLPAQVAGIAQAAIHALTGEGRDEVSSVTEQEDVSLPECLGNERVEGVHRVMRDASRWLVRVSQLLPMLLNQAANRLDLQEVLFALVW